jgi:hypothetical protein
MVILACASINLLQLLCNVSIKDNFSQSSDEESYSEIIAMRAKIHAKDREVEFLKKTS